MRASRLSFIVLWLACMVAVAGSAVAQETAAALSIAKLRGDLYSVRNGAQITVFYVTPDGIVLVDPLSRATAGWLLEQFTQRFPDARVRYVVLSSHLVNRAEGASRFSSTAELVAHSAFEAALSRAREADTAAYAYVQSVRSQYSDRRTITLGGKSVELIHPGPVRAPDATVVLFPAERVLFAADAPTSGRTPFAFGSMRVADVVTWVHTVAALDFDTLLTGTGETIPHDDIVALGNYLDDLVAGVAAGFERGSSLARVQSDLVLDAHRSDPRYADRAAHIEYVYQTVRFTRLDVYGFAGLNSVASNSVYCASTITCETGARLPAAALGVSFSIRRLGFGAEMRMAGQSFSSRTAALSDDVVARRDVFGSALLRYSTAPKSGVSFTGLGGLTVIFEDVVGQDRVKQAFVPLAGRHPIAFNDSALGLTVGGDVTWSLANGMSLIAPVRITRRPQSASEYAPGRLDVYGGLGLRFNIVRRIS